MSSPGNDAAARRRLILDSFDAALDIDEAARADWLRAQFPGDSALVEAIEALLAADAVAPAAMPTELPDGAGSTIITPPERIGAYRLIEPIGGGGMGEVWRAERADGLFEHEVAIKLMRPSRLPAQALAFFDTERRALARLRHRHIARLFDGGVTESGLPWIVMERIDGDPLDAWATAARPSPAQAARLAAALCDATQYAHQKLVAHGDLKPSNILIDSDGEPSLVDFGIAALLHAPTPSTDGAFPSTPAYASPERRAGAAPTPADDVYALGLLLRGLLTGAWPQRDGAVAGAPDDADLAAIVARACAASADQRYPTAAAMADDLRAYLGRRPVEARGGGRGYRLWKFLRRNRWRAAAGGGAALALVGALGVITSLYLEAARERREAEQRFDEVRALAGYMLGDFYDELERTPGAARLRAHTAEVGRVYLERLAAAPTASPDVDEDVAIGYRRVGRALATTSTNATGDVEAGAAALERAEVMLRALLAGAPDRDDLRVELARTLTSRSGVALSADNDFTAGHAFLDEAFALLDDVLTRAPDDIAAGYARWNAVQGRRDALVDEARHEETVRLIEASRRLTDALPAPAAYASLNALLAAADENSLGDARYYLGDEGKGLSHYLRAAAILEDARERGVSDVRIPMRLAYYHRQVSSVLEEFERIDEALDWARRGKEIALELMRYEDSPITLRIYGILQMQHARLLSSLGRHIEALAEATESVDRRRRLFAQNPDDRERHVSLASVLRELSAYRAAAGDGRGSCEAARESSELWKALAAHGGVPARYASDVALVDARLAECGG